MGNSEDTIEGFSQSYHYNSDDRQGVLSFRDLLEYYNDCHPGGIFYHYTSVEAFESIMNSMQLRLTRYDCMSRGEEEGRGALEIAEGIIEGLEKDGIISELLCNRILDVIRSDTRESFTHWYFGSGQRVQCVPYVICFTHIEPDDQMNEERDDGNGVDDVEWILNRDLRIEVRPDFDFLDLPATVDIGCSTFPNWDGICVFRTIDYEKESVYRVIEHSICECLDSCRKNGLSDDRICASIRDIVNEEKMFIYSGERKSLKETRIVVYMPLDRDTIPGIDSVVRPKRMKNASGDWVDLPLGSYENGRYIYLNLKVPLKNLSVSVNKDAEGAFERVSAIMEEAVRKGFTTPCPVGIYSIPVTSGSVGGSKQIR